MQSLAMKWCGINFAWNLYQVPRICVDGTSPDCPNPHHSYMEEREVRAEPYRIRLPDGHNGSPILIILTAPHRPPPTTLSTVPLLFLPGPGVPSVR